MELQQRKRRYSSRSFSSSSAADVTRTGSRAPAGCKCQNVVCYMYELPCLEMGLPPSQPSQHSRAVSNLRERVSKIAVSHRHTPLLYYSAHTTRQCIPRLSLFKTRALSPLGNHPSPPLPRPNTLSLHLLLLGVLLLVRTLTTRASPPSTARRRPSRPTPCASRPPST